jgi:CRISPR-associated protein Csm2
MNQKGKKDFGAPEAKSGFKGREQQGGWVDSQAEMKKWGIDLGRELSDLSKVSGEKIVEIAEKAGKKLAASRPEGIDLKINQIRRFLDEVRQIETGLKTGKFDPDRIILLRPKLAYAAGREVKVFPLMNVIDPAIKSAAQSPENFNKLLRLIESIVAYHRYNGGTN